MQVFVKTLDGSTIAINMRLADSVADFKVAIAGRTGVPPEQQVLSFVGRPLDDKNTLRNYSIESVAHKHIFIQFLMVIM